MDDKKRTEEKDEEVKRFGGYSSRHQYETKKGRTVLAVLQGALLVALICFLALGGVLLVKWYRSSDRLAGEGSGGAIKVPTQSELAALEKEPAAMLREVNPSLVTVEVVLEDGTSRYGSGTLVSQDGYAVCSSTLFDNSVGIMEMLGHTAEGMSYPVLEEGEIRELGLTLIRLEGNYGCTPVPVGNVAFLERGETLFAAAAGHVKEFPGTALSGVVASTGYSVKVTQGETSVSVPVTFLDISPNETLYGAPAVDLTGSAMGIITSAVKSPYGDLAAMVSIHAVYTLINDMYSE
ncbi:MAG: hypothetical protein IKC69_06450 [Clostridia bacterium]|nr:hypothetical protein [Clostridia bacterium]